MNRSYQWDASASSPPVASGQVPFYNPAQFWQTHSTGSAVAPPNTLGDAGHGAVSADYTYGWGSDWNNWPGAGRYNSAAYAGDHYPEQQHSAESGASLTEGGVPDAYNAVYDPNWSMNQPYPMQYPTQYAGAGEYSYDSSAVLGYNDLTTGIVDNFENSSQSAMQPYVSHALEDGVGVSSFFHAGSEVSSSGLLPQVAPPNTMVEGVEEVSGEQLPAVNSFSNVHQPSPFDELGDMKSPQAGLPEQFVLPSSHSRQSSAGGGVQFLIGGSSSVSESQSRTDSPHAAGMEASCSGSEHKHDDAGTEIRSAVTEHDTVAQPHFTDAGSHKTLTDRIDESPVRSQLPQGIMTGTQASGHHRKPAAGSSMPLEHPHLPSDLSAAVSSDADANKVLLSSANAESVHAESSISEDVVGAQQPSHHPLNELEMLVDVSEPHSDVYARLLGSHPDSLFTPVGKALTVNAAISPGQQHFSIGGNTATVPPMPAGSVCSAAGSDGGVLDMHEIELDAMVDTGSSQDVVRRVEAGSSGELVGERGVGSGIYKQSTHDVTPRSHLHHHAKTHREATMSPATTLWENPEPTGVRLLPAPAVLAECRSTADRLPTHELLQNTDAGPSKSAASGVICEPSLDVHSAMHSVEDQRVPQALFTSFSVSQASQALTVNYTSQVASESSSHTFGHQLMVEPATAGSDVPGTVRNESVDLSSEELVRSDISSASHYGHTENSVPAKLLHVAVSQTSGKPASEGVTTEPAGSVVAGGDAIPGPQSSKLRPSAGNEVDRSWGMEAVLTPGARELSVDQAAGRDQQYDDKNTQGNVHTVQSTNMNIHKGIPYVEKTESSDVAASSQRLSNRHTAHQAQMPVNALKSERQDIPSSVPDASDEQYRTSRYRAEVDRPRSRQDQMDQVSRRPSSRQDDERAYSRPRSRQHYDDRGYDRPRSTQGYDVPPYRQMSEDPYGRPRSRQEYEDPYYYRPRSRQGYDYRHDMPGSVGHSYTYPEDGQPRHGYHESVDRPRSQQEYDRPRSRPEYEDWSDRRSRDRYRNNRYGDSDSHNRQGSKHDTRDSREAYRNSDESFNRSRYSATEEGHDRASWNNQEDSRYRASQGFREDEYRRPRSRGGGKMYILLICDNVTIIQHVLSCSLLTIVFIVIIFATYFISMSKFCFILLYVRILLLFESYLLYINKVADRIVDLFLVNNNTG